MSVLKKELFEQCVKYVQNRIDTAQQAIASAQAAANEETKSSAGDKYETGRAMMQQESDRNMAQLNEAGKLMAALNQIGIGGTAAKAETGSLVITNSSRFYIAISAGAITLGNQTYFAVSPASPIGLMLKGQKPGDQFTLNGKTYIIEQVI